MMIVYEDEYGEIIFRDDSNTNIIPRLLDKVNVSGLMWEVKDVIWEPVAKSVRVIISIDEKKDDSKPAPVTDIFSFQRKLESIIKKQSVQDKNISLFLEQFAAFKKHVTFSLKTKI